MAEMETHNKAAREMTPQERAAELAEQISGAHHQLAYPGATVRSLVFDALQETRRAALLEVIEETLKPEYYHAYNGVSALHEWLKDRLAQEG